MASKGWEVYCVFKLWCHNGDMEPGQERGSGRRLNFILLTIGFGLSEKRGHGVGIEEI